MIVKGKEYMIFKPRKFVNPKDGSKIWNFSIGDSKFDIASKTWQTNGFINVSAFTEMELEDRQKVEIKEIIGASVNKYTNKSGVEVSTVIVTVALKEDNYTESDETDTYVDIDVNELPF